MAIIELQSLTTTDLGVYNGVSYFPGRITTFSVDGQDYLITGSLFGGIGLMTVADNGGLGVEGLEGTALDPLEGLVTGSVGSVAKATGGTQFVYITGNMYISGETSIFPSVGVLDVSDPDNIDVVEVINDLEAVGEPNLNQGIDPQIASLGGQDFLIVASGQTTTFNTYEIQNDGSLGDVTASLVDLAFPAIGFTTAEINGRGFVVSSGTDLDATLAVMELDSDGGLTTISKVANRGLDLISLTTQIGGSVEIDGKTYVFAHESDQFTGAQSLLSFELTQNGQLNIVDRIVAGVADAWGLVEEMTSFRYDDETYVATGSNGGILSIFKMSEGGSLIEVDELNFTTPELVRFVDLEVVKEAGKAYIVTNTGSTDPVDGFRFVPDDVEDAGNKNNNTINGNGSDNQIFGRAGNDKLYGKGGEDLIEGNRDKDQLFGGGGSDDLYGNEGGDTISGGKGGDFAFGGDGADVITLGKGGDFAYGGAGKDNIVGGASRDFLQGGGGDDEVFGGAGGDSLFGNNGVDLVYGGAGEDAISDGGGRLDSLFGGNGADTFIMADDGERDRIQDFQNGLDLIDLTAETDLNFLDITVNAAGDNLILSYGNESIFLKSADGPLLITDISAADFIFD